MNINQLKNALPFLFETGITPLIIGQHGVGKTSGVKQFCEEQDYKFVSFRLGQLADAGDMTGMPHLDVTNDVTRFLKPDWWPTEGKGIIFLDEINRARRDLLQCVFELCEKGTMNGRTLPAGWHVAAAMNPDTGDYTVTDVSDKAFLDRFCSIKISSSYKDFCDFGSSKGFNKSVINFISNHPAMLRGNNEDFNLKFVEPSDRSWEKVGLLANIYDSKRMPDDILNELVAGLIGLEASTAYMSWKKNSEKPIEGSAVLQGYDKVRKVIVEQSSAENYRPDLLNSTKQQILDHVKSLGEGTELPVPEYDNLVAFINDLPNDLFVEFVQQAFRIPSLFLKLADEVKIKEKTEKLVSEKEAKSGTAAK